MTLTLSRSLRSSAAAGYGRKTNASASMPAARHRIRHPEAVSETPNSATTQHTMESQLMDEGPVKILQIIPADGWRAHYRNEPGPDGVEPVVCFALVELVEH